MMDGMRIVLGMFCMLALANIKDFVRRSSVLHVMPAQTSEPYA